MKVFKSEQIRDIDAFTIKHEPIQSIDLMERAANALVKWIIGNYSSQSPFFIFVGPGNNGGDGLALARLLIEVGYHVKVFVLASKDYSNDNRVNTQRLIKQGITLPIVLYNVEDFPEIPPNAILVDSLFGSGLSRQLTGVAAELVKYLNAFDNHIVSIDIPSGLHGEENPFPNHNPIIKAHVTLTLQFPKLSFFFSEND
ncbi:MAG: NAD(P)H-hydrate epimerase, partial [Bacteroidetes bacterium HGW-Bacteroidetes-15]